MALWDHFHRGSQGTAALARRLDRRVERQRLRGGRRGRNRRRDVRLPVSRLL
jgi:hypothetical protein